MGMDARVLVNTRAVVIEAINIRLGVQRTPRPHSIVLLEVS